jgi:phage tail-like protein
MNPTLTGYIPPAGFYYAVHLLRENESPFPPADASFQEVSGISVAMETEQIQEGGQNRFTHKVPGRTNYEDLVLKRGLMVRSSALADWCINIFNDNLTQRIEPKTIIVSLLGTNTDRGQPIMTWQFTNAYPIKWEISPLNAQKSEIVIESISFTYSYFEKIN